jgi:hypothetical protein
MGGGGVVVITAMGAARVFYSRVKRLSKIDLQNSSQWGGGGLVEEVLIK